MDRQHGYKKKYEKNFSQDQLDWIKDQIKTSHGFFDNVYKSFNKNCEFFFVESVNDQERNLLSEIGKSDLEFPIGEAYISRLLGEFAKQEPSIYVAPFEGAQVNPQLIEVLQGHFLHVMDEAKKNNSAYRIYKECLFGGWSALEYWTDYANKMSFDLRFNFAKCRDSTLCGWDPLAETPSKADGRFSFKHFPKSWDEAKRKYPQLREDKFSFVRKSGNEFNWSYLNQKEKIVVICEFWKKEPKEIEIYNVAGHGSMTPEQYEKLLATWKQTNILQQAPQIIEKRETEIDQICRYRIVENEILEYEETDYSGLPVLFVEGNSMEIKKSTNGEIRQYTKGYLENIKGVQRLLNYSGQTLGYVLEKMITAPIKMAVETLPDQVDWRNTYTEMQKAAVWMYKCLNPNNPDQILPPPQEVQVPPAPPEIMQTFQNCFQISQNILGSYDAALGIQKNDLSGIAMMEGATQSNATAMPFLVGYLQGLEQVANDWLKMIPKIYTRERSIAIIDKNGQRQHVPVNSQGGVSMQYDPYSMQVRVEAGVNFNIQKTRNLQQLGVIAQAFPIFAQFMSSKGLMILIDNLDIEGAEQLKPLAQEFQLELKQAQEAAKNQPNPAMAKVQLEAQKLQEQKLENMRDFQLKQQEMANDRDELEESKRATDNDTIRILADMQDSQMKAQIEHDRSATEKFGKLTDLAMHGIETDRKHHLSAQDQDHRHAKETIELHHKIVSDKEKNDIEKQKSMKKEVKVKKTTSKKHKD